jgi:hypothetical protein
MDRALPREPADAGRGLALPLYSNGSASPGWWGMVVLLISDAAVIASFAFAYLFLWTARPAVWPPDGSQLPGFIQPVLISAIVIGAWLLFEAVGARRRTLGGMTKDIMTKSAKDLVAEASREVATLSGAEAVKLVGDPGVVLSTCAKARSCKRPATFRARCTCPADSSSSRPMPAARRTSRGSAAEAGALLRVGQPLRAWSQDSEGDGHHQRGACRRGVPGAATGGSASRGGQPMMNDMMGGGMMWGMGLFGLLVIIVLVLAAIALGKYIFSRR